MLELSHNHFEIFNINATNEPTIKIDIEEIAEEIGVRKVVLSDLDIVNHVNNVKYMEWCFDFENYKRLLKQELKAVDINFMQEFNLGEEALIKESKSDKSSIYSIEKENKNAYALKIEWK